MYKYITFITLLLFFHACGGGASQHEPREEKILYFVDSPTNGIDYTCGERSGVTKTYTQNGITKHGLFKCVYSPITFKLGSLTLGSVDNISSEQTIYPQSLVPNFNGDFNNEDVLKIAILLQSLDDHNSSDYINISQQTKEKITLTSLKNITISQLTQIIQKMGFTPVSKDEAKIHLILNSPNIHSGKPKVEAFEEDISSDLTVGNIIGKLNIDRGDADLIFPFTLEGEGKEYFMVNNKGKLILTQSLTTPQTFNLTLTAKNAFGYTTVPVTIHVEDSSKIGKAQMGRLKGSSVKLFKLAKDHSLELVTTETTKSVGSLNQIGNFDLHTELLEDQSYYIYEVYGGVDIDIEDDGIKDNNETPNNGKLHLISKGIWLKNLNQKIRITPLSEMLYSYIERDGFNNIEDSLKKYAQILLKKSLDSYEEIDAKDIFIFNPSQDKKSLYSTLTYDNRYNTIKREIRAGDSNYIDSIFSAYVVDSFQANAIEIIGSSIYTIDMLNSGEFRIYDLDTKKKIGAIKLPNTPTDEDTHTLYINLLVGEVRISSLTDWSYELFIKDQTNPTLDEEPFIKELLMSGNFSRTTLTKSSSVTLFSQERQTHIYNFDTDIAESKTIKFFNVDKHNVFYKFEFNSQLKSIDSLWVNGEYLYVVGENKIHIFKESNTKATLSKIYTKKNVAGNILGIENSILYILKEKILTLYDISSPKEPKFIENITVPFNYKLGIKTNEKYITTGSQIIDIASLRASKIAN